MQKEILHNEFTAIVKQEDDWWIGWIEEVPGVNCQERTHDDLIESLRVTLKDLRFCILPWVSLLQ